MVDLVITPANVSRVDGATQTKNAGVGISAGDALYVDSTGVLQLCENDQTVVEAAMAGIALCDAAVGQPCVYLVSGNLDPGATVAAGIAYIVGGGPGAIAPAADIAAAEFMTIVGVGTSTGNIKLGILQSGVAAA